FTIHDDSVIPFGALHATPFTTWKVMRDLANPIGFDLETVEIVHYHISRGAFSERATIAEARRLRRQRRQPVVRLFQGYLLFIAHEPAQEIGSESAAGEELGVRAAVRGAREGKFRVVNHLCGVINVKSTVGAKEFDVEIASDREIKHHIDRGLIFFL